MVKKGDEVGIITSFPTHLIIHQLLPYTTHYKLTKNPSVYSLSCGVGKGMERRVDGLVLGVWEGK